LRAGNDEAFDENLGAARRISLDLGDAALKHKEEKSGNDYCSFEYPAHHAVLLPPRGTTQEHITFAPAIFRTTLTHSGSLPMMKRAHPVTFPGDA
jgi:hypothetical protein